MKAPLETRTRRVVQTSQFHKHVPAKIPVHVDKDYWGGLTLNVFDFPKLNEGIAAPGVPACCLAFFTGEGGKTYYGLDDSPWIPHFVQKDTFEIVNAGCSTKWQWHLPDDAPPFSAVNLMLEPSLMRRVARQTLGAADKDIEYPTRVDVSDNLIRALVYQLENEARDKTPFGRVYGETAAQLLAVHILKHYSNIKCKTPTAKNGLSNGQFRRVLEYIHAHLQSDISLGSMAGVCGLTSYHFARSFKLTTGTTPHQYVIGLRMKKAAMLLKQTSRSVLDIAQAVGYENQSHFSVLFKRYHGATPSEYRRHC